MVIKVSAQEINSIIRDMDYRIPTAAGDLKLQSKRYIDGKFEFLADFTIFKKVRCIATQFTFKMGILSAHLQCPDNKIAEATLKLASKTLDLSGNGVILDYPKIQLELAGLSIPVIPDKVEFNQEGVEIEIGLNDETLNTLRRDSLNSQ